MYLFMMGDGSTWWLVAVADHRTRSEHVERFRRDLESAYDWERYAETRENCRTQYFASDDEFWSREVSQTALMYIMQVTSRVQLADAGHRVSVAEDGRSLMSSATSPKRRSKHLLRPLKADRRQ